MKLPALIPGVLLATVMVATGRAATIDLSATVSGNVIDDAGGVADGTFDRVQATPAPEVDNNNSFAYRAVMEFALSPIPAGSFVNSAELQWTLGSSTNPPVTVQLHGYVGNGVLEISDGLVDNLLTTVSVPGVPSGGPTTFGVDVTTFVGDLVASNDAFAGFMFRLPDAPFPNPQMTTFPDPTLEIDFAVPAPILGAGLPGMVSVLIGGALLGWRRKRKAQAVA